MGAIFSFLGGIAGIVNKLLGRAEREEYRDAGRDQQQLKQHEDADNAQERMDGVDRGDKRGTIDRLRDGGI